MRWIGFAAGLVLAVAILQAGRLPAEGRATGAAVSMLTQPPDELAITPVGIGFLKASNLKPGSSALGKVEVRNLHEHRVWVSLRGRPANHDLDTALRVEIRESDRTVFTGTLAELRVWTAAFRLGGRQTKTVHFRAFVPVGAAHGYEGRSTPIEIAWLAKRKAT